MKRARGLFATAVTLVGLVAVACSYDFAQFSNVTAPATGEGGAPPGEDGSIAQDGAVSSSDSSLPPTDATVEDGASAGNDGGDAASANDSGGLDAALDAACTDPCLTQATTCTTPCKQTLATCNAKCKPGNPGNGCRATCQAQETTCASACATTCDSCTSTAGCSDPTGCTAATR